MVQQQPHDQQNGIIAQYENYTQLEMDPHYTSIGTHYYCLPMVLCSPAPRGDVDLAVRYLLPILLLNPKLPHSFAQFAFVPDKVGDDADDTTYWVVKRGRIVLNANSVAK